MRRHASTRQILFVLCCSCFSCLLAAPALSQVTTGTIVGKVLDESQAALPGTTITVSSPSLIGGTQVVTTERDGAYRIPNLPSGLYEVSAEVSGFAKAVRSDVRVEADRTLAVDFELTVSTVRETLTVRGEAPLVDVESSRHGVTVDTASIQNIPTGRGFNDILTIQPGVVESPYTFAPVNSVQGSSVRGNNYNIDGFQAEDTTVGYMIGDLSIDSLQEVQITTGGISAEFGQASGGLYNFITKSGGNTFDGGARFYFNDDALNSSNVTPELRAEGIEQGTSIKNKKDWGADVGGPILREKLWFYGDISRLTRTDSVPALASLGDPTFEGWIEFVKLTWRVNQTNTIAGSYQGRHAEFFPANADVGARADRGSWIFNTLNQDNYFFQWTSTIGTNTLLEARYAENLGGGSDRESFPNADPNRAGFVDVATGIDYGWWRSDRWNKHRDAKVLKVAVTHYAADLLRGSHNFKAGFEQERDPFQQILHYPESIQQFLQNLQPFQVTEYVEPTRGARNVTRYSGYVNDQWTVGSGLTVTAGVRFDNNEGWTPGFTDGGGQVPSDEPLVESASIPFFPPVTFAGKHDVINMTTVAPRLGLSWDIAGKHRWVVKANYGRWYDRILTAYVGTPSGGSATYEWNDLNGDGRFERGEEGGLLQTSVLSSGEWDPALFTDPNLRNPYTDSFNAGVEWQLQKNISLDVTAIVKRDKNLFGRLTPAVPSSAYFPISAVNPLDGQPITIYALRPEFRGVTRITQFANPSGLRREYNGVELVLKKRFDSKSQFQVSANIGRARGNQGTAFDSSFGGIDYSNPNKSVNFFGPTDLDATFILKADGTYVAPWDVLVSGFYTYISGYPIDTFQGVNSVYGGLFPGARIGRFFRSDYPQMIVEPFIDVALEPRGTLRQDERQLLTARVEKQFNLPNQTKVGVLVDVFNVFNSSAVTHVQDLRLDSPVFLKPERLVFPRSARVGVRYTF